MFCCKCKNDLSECTCPDLKERFEAISKSPHVHIGADYKERIEAQVKKTENQISEAE